MQASPDEFSKITTDFKVKLTIKLSKYNKYTSSEVFCDLSLRKQQWTKDERLLGNSLTMKV